MSKKQEKTSSGLLKVAKYLRVSSDKQAKTGDSLREQEDTLTDYINKNSNMILYDAYIDDGVSGQKLQRDDFSRLMDDVKSGNVDLIIFTKLDRWFRSLRHYLNTQAILESHNVYWTAVSQSFFDTTTAHGRAFVAQSMTWAELEAQNDSERILAVFKNKVKNGEVISGTTPFGYKIVDKRLVHDDKNAPIAKHIFLEYAKTSNLSGVMMMLRDEYNIYRQPSTIRKLLKNRVYVGEYRGNSEYCPPIVPPDIFEQVQFNLSKNIKANQKYNYIFSGLLYCGHCNNAYSSIQLHIKGHPRKDGTFLRYKYNACRCKTHYDLKTCPNGKVTYESVLETWMIENLRENIQNHIAEFEISSAPSVNNAQKRTNIIKKLTKLKDLYLNDLITLDDYKIDKARFEEQLSSLPSDSQPQKDFSALRGILSKDIENIYFSYTLSDKQRFWRSFVYRIYIDDTRSFRVFFR